MFYTPINRGFLSNQSKEGLIYIIKAIKQLKYISSTECILDFGWSRSCTYLAENLCGKHFTLCELWFVTYTDSYFCRCGNWPMFSMLYNFLGQGKLLQDPIFQALMLSEIIFDTNLK